jgi:UDP-glucose:(heptosyl)LPS alpha-1,3-glucosyltransferase
VKIGLVIESLDAARGGAEQWTTQFAQWLAKAGHEVHIVARHFAAESERLPLTCHTLAATKSRIEFARLAQQRLESLALDVTHDMGSGWHCDVFQPHGGSRLAASERNLQLAPTALRPWKRWAASWLPRYREFEKLAAAQYASRHRLFIALSRMVAHDFERLHRVPEEQIRLVYNGVDVERFSPDHRSRYREPTRERLGVRPDETLLLIVAHNFWLKGVPTLLAAVGRLAAEGRRARLAVVGGTPTNRWIRLAARLGAAHATTFVGRAADPVPYYSAADVYVQPTFYDPCSLVALEALASGLPVVTSRFNGAGELIEPGEQGFILADPADSDELTACLRPLLEAPARAPLATAARRLALAHSFDANCRQLCAVYEEIVGLRKTAPTTDRARRVA